MIKHIKQTYEAGLCLRCSHKLDGSRQSASASLGIPWTPRPSAAAMVTALP